MIVPIKPGHGFDSLAGGADARQDKSSPLLRDAPSSIDSLRSQLATETKAEAEVLVADLAKALIHARRIALTEEHSPGIRELARQVAVFLEPRLNAARAVLGRAK